MQLNIHAKRSYTRRQTLSTMYAGGDAFRNVFRAHPTKGLLADVHPAPKMGCVLFCLLLMFHGQRYCRAVCVRAIFYDLLRSFERNSITADIIAKEWVGDTEDVASKERKSAACTIGMWPGRGPIPLVAANGTGQYVEGASKRYDILAD